MCFVGLDLGTTSIKALAFDEKGHKLASSHQDVTLVTPHIGWCEHNPYQVWSNVKTVLSKLAKQLIEPIEVIAISSQAQAILPLDEEDRPLYNIIVTMDGRTIPQYKWWQANTDPWEIYQHCGMPFSSIYAANKLMWLHENEPIIFEKAKRFCCIQDYIVYCLTGEALIDYSLAGRSMMLDSQNQKWDDLVLSLAKIPKEKLSTPVPSTTIAGKIIPAIAAEIGLSDNIAIVVGGHDQACGALGAGVTRPGMAMNATGTVDALVTVLQDFIIDKNFFKNNYPCYTHVVNEHYLTMAVNPNGGLLLKWFKDTFCQEDIREAAQLGMDVYTYLINKSSDKIADIFVLPHLEGAGTPIFDPESTGAFIGLRVSHTKNDICRAILDSLAYDIKQNILGIEESSGIPLKEIRPIGGGAKTPKWLQIKADIFNKKITTMQISESAALGAAILGAVGIGHFKNCAEAVKAMVHVKDVYLPNPDTRDAYEERYQEYLAIYPALKDINHRLSQRSRV